MPSLTSRMFANARFKAEVLALMANVSFPSVVAESAAVTLCQGLALQRRRWRPRGSRGAGLGHLRPISIRTEHRPNVGVELLRPSAQRRQRGVERVHRAPVGPSSLGHRRRSQTRHPKTPHTLRRAGTGRRLAAKWRALLPSTCLRLLGSSAAQ